MGQHEREGREKGKRNSRKIKNSDRLMKIPVYAVFHHNLLYSSIPEPHYEYIIRNVYSFLLNLVDEGIKLGLEFNGWTLEKISEICPQYIEEVKKLEGEGKVELIASSYTQAIFPLIPYEVNKKNIELGIDVFKRIFGKIPEVFLLNEMVYSVGAVKLLKEFGFKCFIFDWVNGIKGNNWKHDIRLWEVVTNEGLKVLWADTYLTQKFQRFVWEDIDKEDYLAFLGKKVSLNPFAIPIYVGDAEIFEYIPGSLNFTKEGKDFAKLKEAFRLVEEAFPVEFCLPSQVVRLREDIQKISIATADYPVRTKKQEKYNVIRWAVTGRDSAKMNTQCFELYEKIKNKKDDSLWKNLCFLWGSDFRTNTTDEKYLLFRNLMGYSLLKADEKRKKENFTKKAAKNFPVNYFNKGRYFIIETPHHKAVLIKNKGLCLKELTFKEKCSTPIIGTVEHGFYEDISYGADFFSFHLLIATKEGKQITDLSAKVEPCYSFEDGYFKVRNKKPIDFFLGSLFKEYWFSETVKVVYRLYFKELFPMSIRLGFITLLPDAFDKQTLFYETHNGGRKAERFYLEGKEVNLDVPVNYIVTSRGCLGSTEGILTLGDSEKSITIITDKSQLYTVPLVRYKEFENTFFFRISHTICERDEVANVFFKGYNEVYFELR
ncbi:MAG: hypothetical protein Q9M37_08840 [Desulfonauticus sp.]|nr:hypothetical protein [Desulfonauticus sp.]